MERRHWIRLIPAQFEELGRLELALRVVGLVGRNEDRRAGESKEVRCLEVGRRQADGRICDEHDDVGFIDRQPRLLLDLDHDHVAGRSIEAARVDHDEASAVPLRVRIEAVARCVRAILNYAPIIVHVPPYVRIRHIDPVVALQSMTYYLNDSDSDGDAPPRNGGSGERVRLGWLD